VGRLAYVEAIQKQLGPRAKGRDILPTEGGCQLRESEAAYGGQIAGKKGSLKLENTPLGDLSFHLPATWLGPTLTSLLDGVPLGRGK
jgi:hypothetical protein